MASSTAPVLPLRAPQRRRITLVFLASLCVASVLLLKLLPPSSRLPLGVTSTPVPGAVYIECGKEGAFCRFQGKANVRYGAHGEYHYADHTDGVSCGNEAFSDPAVGQIKSCAYVLRK